MARQSADSLGTLLTLGLLAGGGYLGYTEGLKGTLGPEAQKLAQQVQTRWQGIKWPWDNGGVLPPGPLPADPNLDYTMSRWQHSQCSMGLDPNDWAAFRAFEQQRGYSTPTYAPPGWGYNCGGTY